MFYLCNVLFIILYFILIKILVRNNFVSRKFFTIVVTIHLLIVHALRDPYIYPDNVNYANAFEEISTFGFSQTFLEANQWTDWGLGYIGLNWLLSKISYDPQILFISTSIITVIGLMCYFFRTSYSVVTSVLIWMLYTMLFYQSLFVLRQHIACVITLWVVFFVKEKKKAMLLVVLACLVHPSALIILPFLLWDKIFSSKISPIRLFIYAVLGFVFFRILLSIILPFFPRFSQYDESENNVIPICLLGSLMLLHFINGTQNKCVSKSDHNTLCFLSYGVIISVCVIGLPGGGRLSNYFTYILPVAYPMLFKYNRGTQSLKLAYSIFFWGVIIFMFISLMFSSGADAPKDYKFFM